MTASSHPFLQEPLPRGWSVRTVDEVKSSQKHSCVAGPFGSSIASKFFVEKGVPVIRGSNLTLGLERFISENFAFITPEKAASFSAQTVVPDDLVFTCWGTIGQVGIIPRIGPYDRYIISNKQLKLRVNSEILDPVFAYYFFASQQSVEFLKSQAIGSAVPGINLGILKALPLLLPPIKVQKEIVSILSAYDELIANNRKRIAVLEDIARRMFEEWFIFFRFPGGNGGMPRDWVSGKFGDVVSLRKSKTNPGEHLSERFYVPIECIGRKTLALTERRPWQEAQSSLQTFERGDILFGAMRAYFHKVCIAPFAGIARSTCFVLTPSAAKFRAFATLLAFRDETVAYAAAHSKGSTIPYAQWEGSLEKMPTVIPSDEVLSNFQRPVAPMLDMIAAMHETQRNLYTTRELLLPKLISGEIEVRAAEDALEATAA